MPRPRRFRRVWFEPNITYFKPAGVRLNQLDETILTIEELESIRLADFENLEQKQAAKKMKISQPTFQRLITIARKKIAEALVNGKAIRIQGGNYKMVQQPRRGMGRGMGKGRMGGPFGAGPGGVCKCPKCGHEEPQIRGQPCMSKKCPKCGTQMIRKQ
jgi:predicted DNA-binding protein (UPF0251 family)